MKSLDFKDQDAVMAEIQRLATTVKELVLADNAGEYQAIQWDGERLAIINKPRPEVPIERYNSVIVLNPIQAWDLTIFIRANVPKPKEREWVK